MVRPWETNNSSSNHKIHSILPNTKAKAFSQMSTIGSYAGPDKSISWHSTFSFNISFNNTLPSIPMFPKGSLFFGLAKSNPCMYFCSSIATPHALSTSSPFILITRLICGEDHKLWNSSLCILQPPVTSPLPRHVLSSCLSLNVQKK